MGTDDLNAWLMFGTLGAGLLIAIILYLRFMRKPENHHPMRGERERNINEIREEAGEHKPR